MLAAPQLIAALLWCQAPQPAPAAPSSPVPSSSEAPPSGAAQTQSPVTSTAAPTLPAQAGQAGQTGQPPSSPTPTAPENNTPPQAADSGPSATGVAATPPTPAPAPAQPESAATATDGEQNPAEPEAEPNIVDSETIGAELGAGVGMEAEAPQLSELRERNKNKPGGRYLIAVEGVGLQGPSLRLRIAEVDLRSVGERTSMGGFGALARVAASDRVSAELGFRTGIVRFRDRAQEREIQHNVTLLSAGAALFMAKGQMGRLGLEGGIGAVFNRVGYQLGNRGEGSQSFTSFQSYVGIAGEFQAKRLIVTISVRSYGVVTALDSGRTKGTAFETASKAQKEPPVPALQAYLAAALGLGYQF